MQRSIVETGEDKQKRPKRRHARRPKLSIAPSREGFAYPADEDLCKEVQEYMDQLQLICRPEQIQEDPHGFTGVFLEPVEMELKPRHGKGAEFYKNTTIEYSGYVEKTKAFLAARQIFCRGLAKNPTTRALSLLALGRGSVKMMERGLAPSGLFNRLMPADYNRHHIAQKSGRPLDGRPINHLSNLVLINAGATGEWRLDPHSPSYSPLLDPADKRYNPRLGERPELNSHHFFHGAVLLPQTENTSSVNKATTVYCPRPAFPVFPPLSGSSCCIKSRQELYDRLEELEPGITEKLPNTFEKWADKLVAFAKACRNQPYKVPKPYHDATRDYTHIYERLPSAKAASNKAAVEAESEAQLIRRQDTRRACAAKNHELVAASFLPLTARVNGKTVQSVLETARKRGDPVEHHPIPLVPKGWKPLRSYETNFPSIDRIHRNMSEVGLKSVIPAPPPPRSKSVIESFLRTPFMVKAYDRLKQIPGVPQRKRLGHSIKTPVQK